MKKRARLIIVTMLFAYTGVLAQTLLSPGDIAIVTLNSDSPKNFDFVCFRELSMGTEIHFTDKGWDGSNLSSTEGIISYLCTEAVSAGTIISFNGIIEGNFTETGSFILSGSGDNCLIYQGNVENPHFLYGTGLARTTIWISSGLMTSNTSYIPNALSKADHTIMELGAGDNYQYDMEAGNEGSADNLLSLINDTENWLRDDATVYNALAGKFTISDQSLSVSLSVFAVELDGDIVKLHWITASETENAGFSLFRSISGGRFELVVSFTDNSLLAGKGSCSTETEYNLIDAAIPDKALLSYMLSDTDYSGKEHFHDDYIQTIEVLKKKNTETKEILAYPNPFNTSLTLENESKDLSKMAIYSINGKIVATLSSWRIKHQGNNYIIDFNGLAAGVYFIKVINKMGETASKKVMYLP